ncbi:MAG: hypothetical protein C4527_18395 [Candidatus Omnitrophota bacterium]|jgi:hypothetical protein|nr:MAG: hypothetical protein C4527_18395 [Candidatus Omnitrophota bacterium]
MEKFDLEKGFQEIWKLYEATDRRFAETDKRFTETDKRFAETDKRFAETDKRLDQRIAELQECIKATDRQMARTDKKIEDMFGKWGLFVEGLIYPSAKKMFQERGIEVVHVSQHVKVSRNGQEGMEIDILCVNGDCAILIEAKSTLGVQDVDEHIARLEKFKKLFPEYADRKALGAVAGIVIQENVDRYAFKKGLFVIAQSGETVKIINDAHFIPKEW